MGRWKARGQADAGDVRGGECGSHSEHWLIGSWFSYVGCLLDVQLVRLILVHLDETTGRGIDIFGCIEDSIGGRVGLFCVSLLFVVDDIILRINGPLEYKEGAPDNK